MLARPGEHCDEILSGLGFDAATVADLKARQVAG
jgi:crotonobetainyl-CoA:carnitine CoA-transferase CaiB-like acyl-CoA transferase